MFVATHVAVHLMVTLLRRVVPAALRRILKHYSFEGVFSPSSLPPVHWTGSRNATKLIWSNTDGLSCIVRKKLWMVNPTEEDAKEPPRRWQLKHFPVY